MAKNMSKRGLSLFIGCAFLLAAVMFTAVAVHALKRPHTTLDKVIMIGEVPLMLVGSIVSFVRASRLPRETE